MPQSWSRDGAGNQLTTELESEDTFNLDDIDVRSA
ncbi:hypothetical protein L915_15578 [Phytophthora nicotianae]|uniref:Uncharacterized protein n=1 Tax=Phytophthora nicotianae TaxID=4792 RepID=W2G7Z1_PHYNI|nr:hypothetical protein L915_15578 [Phytophthora nicotianae]